MRRGSLSRRRLVSLSWETSLTIARVEFTRAEGMVSALDEVSSTQAEALFVLTTALTLTHRSRVTDFTLKNRMPLVSSISEWAV